MGATDERPPGEGPIVVHLNDETGLSCEVVLEDGSEARLEGRVELPLGYHSIEIDGVARTLIVSPGACHLRADMRTWGWAPQLYALRSSASWGIGDLADLREMARWSAEQGAGATLVNPLHATYPEQASPYFPSSRCYRNPLYLPVDLLPGASEVDLSEARRAGIALNSRRTIDRAEVHKLKSDAFAALFERAPRHPAMDAYIESEGELLKAYAAFVVLARQHGTDTRLWPSAFRRPDAARIERFVDSHPDCRLEMWLQFHLDRLLQDCGEHLEVIQDLAVGVDPGGFDAWYWQDQIAPGISVGAPPDEFNLAGQSWGVAAFDPWALRAASFEPFIRTIRANLSAGGLRIDHVMGLFRLFWVPPGGDASLGTYVRYPAAELLDILALESHRAGAFVVGEDLGTVEDGVRDELARRRILSYKVLWFEPGPPSDYPTMCLATVTNHDLPTVPGMWTGADLRAQKAVGVVPNEDSERAVRDRLREVAGIKDGASVEAVVDAAYGLLSEAPSMFLTATFEDALGVEERPNQPGTADERPNWALALPYSLEEIESHDGPARIAAALGRGVESADG